MHAYIHPSTHSPGFTTICTKLLAYTVTRSRSTRDSKASKQPSFDDAEPANASYLSPSVYSLVLSERAKSRVLGSCLTS